MQKELLRHYLKINLPGITAFVVLYIIGKFNVVIFFSLHHNGIPVTMMIAEALFAVVLPLWYRIHFVNKSKGKKHTKEHEFMQFEKHFLTIASVSVYILIVGYLLALPGTPLSIMVLFVLYALYFYFPSEKRIRSEMKIFKVN